MFAKLFQNHRAGLCLNAVTQELQEAEVVLVRETEIAYRSRGHHLPCRVWVENGAVWREELGETKHSLGTLGTQGRLRFSRVSGTRLEVAVQADRASGELRTRLDVH